MTMHAVVGLGLVCAVAVGAILYYEYQQLSQQITWEEPVSSSGGGRHRQSKAKRHDEEDDLNPECSASGYKGVNDKPASPGMRERVKRRCSDQCDQAMDPSQMASLSSATTSEGPAGQSASIAVPAASGADSNTLRNRRNPSKPVGHLAVPAIDITGGPRDSCGNRNVTPTSEQQCWRDDMAGDKSPALADAPPPPAAAESILWEEEADFKHRAPVGDGLSAGNASVTWSSDDLVCTRPVASMATYATNPDDDEHALEDEIARMDRAMQRLKERREHLELLRNQSTMKSMVQPASSGLSSSQNTLVAHKSGNQDKCLASDILDNRTHHQFTVSPEALSAKPNDVADECSRPMDLCSFKSAEGGLDHPIINGDDDNNGQNELDCLGSAQQRASEKQEVLASGTATASENCDDHTDNLSVASSHWTHIESMVSISDQ